MKKLYVVVIISTLILVLFFSGFFFLKKNVFLDKEEPYKNLTWNRYDIEYNYCLAVVTLNENSCKNQEQYENCMSAIKLKKASINKDSKTCREIEKYPQSELFLEKGYLLPCELESKTNSELKLFDCGSQKETRDQQMCIFFKKVINDNQKIDDLDVTEKDKINLIKAEATFIQNEAPCTKINNSRDRTYCVLYSTNNSKFCEEYASFKLTENK